MPSPVNTTKPFWPNGGRINGVPLYTHAKHVRIAFLSIMKKSTSYTGFLLEGKVTKNQTCWGWATELYYITGGSAREKK